MKFSKTLGASLLAYTAAASVNTVTVTSTVHDHSTVTLIEEVYLENETTFTSKYIEDGTYMISSTPTSTSTGTTSNPTSSSLAKSTSTGAASKAETASSSKHSSTSTASRSASSSASSATATASLAPMYQQMLDETNKKRALHVDTAPLTWSEELAKYAQNYADNYDCSGDLIHSHGPYGENLAEGTSAVGAVDAWYNEITDYDYSKPDFSMTTGHFTQLVWKSTTQMGCAYRTCDNIYGTYVVCEYNPPGNFLGQFGSEVAPLKSSSS